MPVEKQSRTQSRTLPEIRHSNISRTSHANPENKGHATSHGSHAAGAVTHAPPSSRGACVPDARPSQSLTTPQRVRYSPTMATRWSTEQRTHALDLLANGIPLTDVVATTEIPKQTLSRWAKDAGLDLLGLSRSKATTAIAAAQARWEQRRAVVADKAGRLAELAADEATRLLSEGEYLEAQRLMTVMGVSVDKAQLLTGAATARTELVPERTPEQEQELAKVLTLVQGAA